MFVRVKIKLILLALPALLLLPTLSFRVNGICSRSAIILAARGWYTGSCIQRCTRECKSWQGSATRGGKSYRVIAPEAASYSESQHPRQQITQGHSTRGGKSYRVIAPEAASIQGHSTRGSKLHKVVAPEAASHTGSQNPRQQVTQGHSTRGSKLQRVTAPEAASYTGS